MTDTRPRPYEPKRHECVASGPGRYTCRACAVIVGDLRAAIAHTVAYQPDFRPASMREAA